MAGKLLERETVTGLAGGKTAGLKVMVSPICASSKAWRNVPGPLSTGLATTMVLPCGIGVDVGIGAGVGLDATGVRVGGRGVDVGVTGTAEGEALGPQLLFIPSARTVATRNNEVSLCIFHFSLVSAAQ